MRTYLYYYWDIPSSTKRMQVINAASFEKLVTYLREKFEEAKAYELMIGAPTYSKLRMNQILNRKFEEPVLVDVAPNDLDHDFVIDATAVGEGLVEHCTISE